MEDNGILDIMPQDGDDALMDGETGAQDTSASEGNGLSEGGEVQNSESVQDQTTDTSETEMSGMENGAELGEVDSADVGGMDIGTVDSMDIGGMDGMDIGGVDMNGMETSTVKDPVLSSVPFVAGTIAAALVVGIVLGILLGKKRIKKGFDSYED